MKKLTVLSLLVVFLSACQQATKKEAKSPENQQQTTKKETPDFDHKAYKMKGMLIAKTTFKTFKGNIQKIAQTKGFPEVVSFCHDKANHLADSIGKAHDVVIKRTSHRLRNPENAPDSDQKAVLDNYLRLQEDPSRTMEPMVMKDDAGFVHFYAPIKLKSECLKCHGIPEQEIKEPILKQLKKYYSNDKATGFKEGELRGIWDIKFLK